MNSAYRQFGDSDFISLLKVPKFNTYLNERNTTEPAIRLGIVNRILIQLLDNPGLLISSDNYYLLKYKHHELLFYH